MTPIQRTGGHQRRMVDPRIETVNRSLRGSARAQTWEQLIGDEASETELL
jgi:hypothetical protein